VNGLVSFIEARINVVTT